MGWYVQCKFCKQEEKYKHPNCGCLYNQYLLLQHKIKNKLMINQFTYEDQDCTYTCIKYDNVCTLFTISRDEWFTPSPYAVEISLRSYNLHQLYALDYTDESINKLFLLHQFMNHNDIISVIGPMLNIEEDDEEVLTDY